jgi:uncharacterized protein YggE
MMPTSAERALDRSVYRERSSVPIGHDGASAFLETHEEPAMRAARFTSRSLLYGVVVVVLAMTGLALLSEALAKGGSTVYLANFNTDSGSIPTEPSIVVTGSGRAIAPAERALVQLLIVRDEPFRGEAGWGSLGTPAAGAGDAMAEVTDAIREAGVERAAVRVVASPSLISVCQTNAPCSSARIDVTIEEPDLEKINAIIDAAGEATGEADMTIQDVGAGYSVADCRALQADARTAATADARARAAAQATALGVELGGLLLASEAAADVATDAAGCPTIKGASVDAWWSPGSFGLSVPSFDPLAVPEAVVELQVTLAFAMNGDPNAATTDEEA